MTRTDSRDWAVMNADPNSWLPESSIMYTFSNALFSFYTLSCLYAHLLIHLVLPLKSKYKNMTEKKKWMSTLLPLLWSNLRMDTNQPMQHPLNSLAQGGAGKQTVSDIDKQYYLLKNKPHSTSSTHTLALQTNHTFHRLFWRTHKHLVTWYAGCHSFTWYGDGRSFVSAIVKCHVGWN